MIFLPHRRCDPFESRQIRLGSAGRLEGGKVAMGRRILHLHCFHWLVANLGSVEEGMARPRAAATERTECKSLFIM